MRPPIIGVCGYARAGKDTVAQLLKPHGYERVAFADKLKDLLLAVNPFVDMVDDIRLEDYVKALGWERTKAEVAEVRPLLQRLGQGVREIVDTDAWVNAAFANRYRDIVVPDVRYPNEVHAIEARGGEVWRIVRPGVGPANAHVSESALDVYDFPTLHNDGSIADLAHAVEYLLNPNSAATHAAVNRKG